jgi:hypothetical protein
MIKDHQIKSYVLMGSRVPFFIGPDLIVQWCVEEGENYDILKDFRDYPYGGNFVEKRTLHKVLNLGYYWPSLPHNTWEVVIASREWDSWSSLRRYCRKPKLWWILLGIGVLFYGSHQPSIQRSTYSNMY